MGKKVVVAKEKASSNKATAQGMPSIWKPPLGLYGCLMLVAIYLGVVTAGVWVDGDTFFTIFPKIMNVVSNTPLKPGLNKTLSDIGTLAKCEVIYIGVALFYILLDVSKNRNYMKGKEYGTAQWASIAAINKKFADMNHPEYNRIYSEKLRVSADPKTGINNNALVIGGSGVGKSFYLLTPNLHQASKDSLYPGSLIITDPKGELLRRNGAILKEKGYEVKVLNLVPGMMHESDKYNPFKYIRSEADIIKLINNIYANTTPPGATPQDPFWQNAELMLWDALFLIVWMEHDLFDWEMNFNTVLWLLSKAEIGEKATDKSPLDRIFEDLVIKTGGQPGKGEEHPAYLAYKKVMVGAADTKRSIVISAHARMSILENPEIKRILSGDELDLASIGTGRATGENESDPKIKRKPRKKTALFCVIPDSDTSYNCVAGMMYTQLFQELYFQADFKYDGKLPVPVTFWLDEFSNIALPKDFIKMLTTMRSRLISCVIIIQNLAQIKALFEKEWEEIPGNCDVCVYLGGNEQSTFEYISKNLGKKTIYKKSQGETKGMHGNSSTNEDVLGRELMLPEEVRELDNEYCIVFVRGMKPIFDHKFRTYNSPDQKRAVELGPYMHSQQKNLESSGTITLATDREIRYAREHGLLIDIMLDNLLVSPSLDTLTNLVVKNKEEEQKELERVREVEIDEIPLMVLLRKNDLSLSAEELVEVMEGIRNNLSEEEIKEYILYGDAERMKQKRILLETIHASEQMKVRNSEK